MILLETISTGVTDIFLYSTIAITVVALLFVFITLNKAKKALEGMPIEPKSPTTLPEAFFGIFAAAILIVGGLKYGLEEGVGTMNTLLFGAFPYVTIGIFILGSVYRYTKKGYQVSSLSSQFLEGKKLFWGSQPFHWGMLILFLGHLVAFLFPRTIIAWNGEPVRLLILEYSAFAFALSALLGLGLLVKRRLQTKTLLMVSNKMDMLVYVVLFVQILSGLGIAIFARWGSTWFAATLTPYLRSIFALNPDTAAVSAMPWIVQIHIISAFFIIAIIPFTRFMHFLVAPIDYIWRDYQLVIWNWNRKRIRRSTAWWMGRKIKNH